jgi:hypothetical protein
LNKIKREEFKLAELTDRELRTSEWHYNNPTSERYRRSMVPFYLLENESNKYPIYVDVISMNQNLTKSFKINKITIHLSQSVLEAFKPNQLLTEQPKLKYEL